MSLGFTEPWLLVALLVLPLLWWLLRVTPPAPRRMIFPPARLLRDLPPTSRSAARTPPWLLALRLLAAALLIVGLAGPVIGERRAAGGTGTLLVVVDDGWASAADWGDRTRAIDAALAVAARDQRPVALLTTAPSDNAATPLENLDAGSARSVVATWRPKPWPTNRPAATKAIATWGGHGSVLYVGDGLDGAEFAAFSRALTSVGPVTTLATGRPPALLMLPALPTGDGIVARISRAGRDLPAKNIAVLAQDDAGRTLARIDVPLADGATTGRATLKLPPEPRNRLQRLVIAEPATGGLAVVAGAGSVSLLDVGARRHDVALPDAVGAAPSADAGDGQDAPLRGAGYFLRRALAPVAEISGGTLTAAIARKPAMILLPDRPLQEGTADADALNRYVSDGGLLLRFAGPELASATTSGIRDPLLPVPLLGAGRQLGGTMSWDQPQAIAPAPAGSPYAGLPVPADVLVSRQVLADPAADLGVAAWLRLRDGTPLVTQRPIGLGRVVLVHATANADWSNLPLSGFFVDLLRRTLTTSNATGDAPAVEDRALPLTPSATLDGDGVLGPPPQGVLPIAAGALGTTPAGPTHPPGFYGPEASRRALDLAANLAPPRAAPDIAGAKVLPMRGEASGLALGPPLLGIAALLLVLEGVLALGARGLLRRAAVAGLLLMVGGTANAAPSAPPSAPAAALSSRLGYIRTGDAAVDDVSRLGLIGLSAYLRARTAVTLDEPDAVAPGTDDLSFYPMLYWPLATGMAPPGNAEIVALNSFMAHGGILVIDSRDGGAGNAFDGGASAALQALVKPASGVALDVPPLVAVSTQHVLARAFYLLRDYPGRYAGSPVYVARDEDRSNDGVSPIVVGANDWAAAWAVDDQGQYPFATLPGGERQRTLAYRFGVNLVVYALTGSYKADQVHLPALLKRLGQ